MISQRPQVRLYSGSRSYLHRHAARAHTLLMTALRGLTLTHYIRADRSNTTAAEAKSPSSAGREPEFKRHPH
jgi:hypothetical protein